MAQTPRPVSKVEKNDPREFQLNQLRRRFRPQEQSDENGSALTFGLAPSDPDFPFELDALQCVLHVPNTYPGKGRPRLTVTNPEMEAAFQANVSRGFDDLVDFAIRTNARGTLLNWVNTLDRQLERLLTTLERGPKLTFVANVGNGAVSLAPTQRTSSVAPVQPRQTPTTLATTTSFVATQPAVVAPSYTDEQKVQAEKRRSMEMKQLEARLGRLPLFQKRSETTFNIPILPTKQDRLPRSLQAVKIVKLIVPPLYPLEHSFIEIQGVDSPEARSVEAGFAQWFDKNSQMNLISQINYLASNMHNFAKTPLPEVAEQAQHEHLQVEEDTSAPQSEAGVPLEATGDKPHLHVIPRPPEWSVPEQQSGSDLTDESSYAEDSEEYDDLDSEEGGAPVPAVLDTPGRGVALSFPFLELYGIELLEVSHLAITIKCERCKESMDIKNVPQLTDPKDVPKIESCKKCANSMSIGFRKQLMHSHANRAGYLDLDGCTVLDLLPRYVSCH